MIQHIVLIPLLMMVSLSVIQAQVTQIPNADFENWNTFTGYQDPQNWDTPNMELLAIPIFGQAVVSKSTSHFSGNFSAKLETRTINIPGAPIDVPGVVTLGKLSLDIFAGTYEITGGAPVQDQPTHLKGFYKYSPVGGDSCGIGIMLFKTSAGIADTVGIGYFSSKVTVPDWTPFSAWINYLITTQPDTMNIVVISTAQYDEMHNGTVLYIDGLYLDYTTGIENDPASKEISVYHDKETKRLIVFAPSANSTPARILLFNLMGQKIHAEVSHAYGQDRTIIPYGNLNKGIYILEVLLDQQKYCKKFFLNP